MRSASELSLDPGSRCSASRSCLRWHLQFEVVTTAGLYECSARLGPLLQGGMEQRLQALQEFRSHIRFVAIDLAIAIGGLSSFVQVP